MSKRIIAVFTGNRAEYGLQLPILKAIDEHPDLEYRLIVSGSHFDANFGSTLNEITNDGFSIDKKIDIKMDEDSLFSTSKAIGNGIISISDTLNEMRPDILIVYGDRFESFSAVISGTQMNIPTAHVEGGDITEGGALDDSVRHAMSKLSHIHFTTNIQAAKRLIAMGEESWRVYNVGFPAIDMIKNNSFASKEELIEKYQLILTKPIIIFTQHSVTTEYEKAFKQIKTSLDALEKLANEGAQVIITYPNNDAGGRRIIEEIKNIENKRISSIQIHKSLGRYNYHGILALAKDINIKIVCAGNSSSGIKETPAFGCPAVNIGSRQKGRLRSTNVVDADYNTEDIYNKINKCLKNSNFRKKCGVCENPYGDGNSGTKIANILANIKLDDKILRKGMTLAGEAKNGWYR